MSKKEAINLAKRQLRKQITSALSRVSDESLRQQSLEIATSLRRLSEYGASSKIAVYMHMEQSEILTDNIIINCYQDGKSVFLPKIVPVDKINSGDILGSAQFKGQKSKLEMLRVDRLTDIQALTPKGPYKLLEPEQGHDAYSSGGLDMIVVPGLGFNPETLTRLGRGKGFYDGFIREHKAWSHANGRRVPFLVGIAAEEQLVEDIPVDDFDQRLDLLLVRDKVYKLGD